MSSVDAHLVKRCLDGDTKAFGALVEKYKNAVFAVGFQYFRQIHDVEDMAQETFIRAYCKLEQLKEPEKFGSWLFSIAKRCCQTKARDVAHHGEHLSFVTQLPTSEMQSLASQEHDRRRRQEEVWDAVNALPETHRLPIILHYIHGYSYREIASLLSVSPLAVKGRLQRARLLLKKEIFEMTQEERKMIEREATFNERLETAICQIEKMSIRKTIPAVEAGNVVLYIGLFNADIQIIGHGSDDVKISGTKFAFGYRQEEVKRRLKQIEVKRKQLDSFYVTGPQKGEAYLGVRSKDELEPYVIDTQKQWQQIRSRLEDQGGDIVQKIRETLSKQLTCISVVNSKVEGIKMEQPVDQAILKAFRPSWSGGEITYGPAGGISLTIEIPKGCALSVIGGSEINVSNIEGTVSILGGGSGLSYTSLHDVKSDAYIYDAFVGEVKNVNGNLMVYSGHSGLGAWKPDRISRKTLQEPVYENISGNLNIAVDNAPLVFRDICGKAFIKNVYGDTNIRLREWSGDNEWVIESVSGKIQVMMDKVVADDIRLSATTRCGSISYGLWRSYPNFPHNSTPECVWLRSVANDEAVALTLLTQSGDIVLETVRS